MVDSVDYKSKRGILVCQGVVSLAASDRKGGAQSLNFKKAGCGSEQSVQVSWVVQ
jgi:hypothetical protein